MEKCSANFVQLQMLLVATIIIWIQKISLKTIYLLLDLLNIMAIYVLQVEALSPHS